MKLFQSKGENIMHLGKRIYYLRKIKGLSQEQLSKGIVSPSHLSNIECGRYEPLSDIISLLATRLDVEKEYLLRTKEVDEELNIYLNQFEKFLYDFDYNQANVVYKVINSKYPFINSIEQEFHFILLETLLYIRSNNLAGANDSVLRLEKLYVEEIFVQKDQKFIKLYYYVYGMYNYYQRDYLQSYQNYLKLLTFSQNNIEQARIYFNISLVCLKLRDQINAITYANSSLKLYLHSHELEKAIDVYGKLKM